MFACLVLSHRKKHLVYHFQRNTAISVLYAIYEDEVISKKNTV